jgi:transposase
VRDDRAYRAYAAPLTWAVPADISIGEPMAWLTDVRERVVSGRTKAHELHGLLPWNWRPTSNVELAEAA